MNDLLTTILQNITTKPDAVKVTMQLEGDVEVYTIVVDPEDIGRVIGKSGKVIRAIRSLAHVAAVHTQKKVRVHLEDGNPPMPAEGVPPSAVEPNQPEDPAPAEPQMPIPDPIEQSSADQPVPADGQPLPDISGEVNLSEPATNPEPQPAPAPDTADLLPEESA